MRVYQRMAVLVDEVEHAQPMLIKALELCEQEKASLTCLASWHLEPGEYVSSLLSHTARERHKQQVVKDIREQLVQCATHLDQSIDIDMVDFSFLGRGLEKTLHDHHYDLLITSRYHNGSVAKAAVIEQTLLRQPETDVLFVGNQPWHQKRKVLTAIELDESTTQHKNHNLDIAHHGEHLALIWRAENHVLSCVHSDDIDMNFVDGDIKTSDNSQYLAKVKDLDIKYLTKMHLIDGLPDDVIPKISQDQDIDVVVVGSAEHHGIRSWLLGHTSEVLLHQVDCDLLAVKSLH